ncbi:hypothetical protein GCK32_015174, partial [Trichostrongylus colubriformis]
MSVALIGIGQAFFLLGTSVATLSFCCSGGDEDEEVTTSAEPVGESGEGSPESGEGSQASPTSSE